MTLKLFSRSESQYIPQKSDRNAMQTARIFYERFVVRVVSVDAIC